MSANANGSALAASFANLPDSPGTYNGGTRNLKCMKYSLMVINSFGVLLGFFIVLFGFAYKEVQFPFGGYSGRKTAVFACFFIFFSVIGYCGASQQKNFFLVPYAMTIFIGIIYTFFIWATTEREGGCLPDPKTLSISGFSILLLMLAAGLVFKLRRASRSTPMATSMDSMEKSSTTRSTSSMIAASKGKI